MSILSKFNELYTSLRMEYDRKIIRRVIETDLMKSVISENSLKKSDAHRVNFILENMLLHSGGHTSILRIATELFELGYDVQYVYTNEQSESEIEEISRVNLSSYKGKIIKYSSFDNNESDIIIATASNTVFSVMRMKGYKMYFVQDYEPTFFSLGDRYLAAKKTYEMGLHIVSLGKWNVKMIENECQTSSILDYVDFPCEISEYPYFYRDYSLLKEKKEIVIAAYIKKVGRRLPLFTQELLLKTAELFKKNDDIDLKIIYFGEKKNFRCIGGENRGKINKQQLCELYMNADFGFVASYSNVSLVPFEMISCGLPIIEIKDGSYLDFMPETTAIITEMSPIYLYKQLKAYIDMPEKINDMIKDGKKEISALSWKKSGEQFSDILKSIINKEQ